MLLALLLGCGRDDALVLFAAASTGPAGEELLAGWEGPPVRVSTASTSTLVRQVQAGAHADVLLAAHPRWAAELAPLRAEPLLGNALVPFAPKGASWTALEQGEGCVAVGDPEHVPVGLYARQLLEGRGTWAAVSPRVVPTVDAPAAVQAVKSGGCPWGIAYRTDVPDDLSRGAPLSVEALTYPLLLLDARGEDLFEHLRSEAAWTTWQAHGFVRP